MRATSSISGSVIGAIAAALVAASVFGGAPALVSAVQSSPGDAPATVGAASKVAVTPVDRTHKGDRLPASGAGPAANTTTVPTITIVPKNGNSSGVPVPVTGGTQIPGKIIILQRTIPIAI